MLKKIRKFTEDASISEPIAYVIFIRIFIKVFIFLSALYFKLNYASLSIIIFIFLVTEIYRNIGTILSATKKFPDELIGGIISALDGAMIVLLLYYTNLLGSYLYIFIILSIAFDTIEYGITAGMAEGLTASISYVFLEGFISTNYTEILIKALIIIIIGIITGWLSEKMKNSEKLLQNTLMKSKKAQRLNKIKDEFIGISSHKVKTPISVIKGYIELLLNGRAGDLNEAQKDYLLKIDANTSTLNMLIDDLLSILTLQNNKITIIPAENYIIKLLNEIKSNFEAEEKIKNIKYLTDIDIKDNKLAVFDYDKIKIAISNILSYSFEKSRESITLRSYVNENSWFIEVKDDSLGVSKNEVKRILSDKNEIFQTIKELGNKGLNLYISNLIIQAHKGRFEIISIEGIGTTFKIKLPL
jgi:signal transduction histidine kinase